MPLVEDGLAELKTLLADDSSVVIRTDDSFLLRFLHCVEFKPDEAYKMLKTWNGLRLEHAEWFCTAPPEEFINWMNWHSKAILEGRDRSGRRIYVTKMGRLRPSETTINEMSRFDDLWVESVLDEPETQASGLCCIIDMEGYSWRLFKWLTPRNLRISTKCVQNAPIKSLVLHIVNSSMLLNASVALIYPFLSNELKTNILFHQRNWTSLHEHIDPELLPEEYGGTKHLPDFSNQNAWLLNQSRRLVEKFKRDHRM